MSDMIEKAGKRSASAQTAYLNHFAPGSMPNDLIHRFLPCSPFYELWVFYLDFLDTGDVGSVWEASRKTELLRSTYHLCLKIPLENVESLWVQYEAFEMSVDTFGANRLLSLQARIMLRQLAKHLAGLDINGSQSDIFLPPATFSGPELELIGRWKAVFSWTASVGRAEEGLLILEAGLEANPDSFALTYTYAELLEKAQLETGTRNFCEIRRLCERFVGVLRDQLVLARSQNSQEDLLELKKQYTNAWINYLRFIHAGNVEYIGWELYEWAVITQYRCDPQDGHMLAVQTFETGMERHASNATYILSYLGFLLTSNDQNDARALFERVILMFIPQEAKPVCEYCQAQAQYQYADLEACLDLQRRMAEVYPDADASAFVVSDLNKSFLPNFKLFQQLPQSTISMPNASPTGACVSDSTLHPDHHGDIVEETALLLSTYHQYLNTGYSLAQDLERVKLEFRAFKHSVQGASTYKSATPCIELTSADLQLHKLQTEDTTSHNLKDAVMQVQLQRSAVENTLKLLAQKYDRKNLEAAACTHRALISQARWSAHDARKSQADKNETSEGNNFESKFYALVRGELKLVELKLEALASHLTPLHVDFNLLLADYHMAELQLALVSLRATPGDLGVLVGLTVIVLLLLFFAMCR
ncbi:hypothetical protein C8R46DRAFT_1034874 [Mycena filopes]|nr:hypothetical protein C8R46DRAFT_1034874 [Mycena filopes]